jgi:hypothetical protein
VTRRPITTGEGQDAFTGWRKYLLWQPGELRRVKRRNAKCERRQAKAEIRRERER